MISLASVFLLVLMLTWWFTSSTSPLKVFDVPNDRSLHDNLIPKTGGIALLVGVFFGWLWQLQGVDVPAEFYWIVAAAIIVATVSLIDDVKELSPLLRIMTHAVAAVMLVIAGLSIHATWFGQLFSFIAIIWMLNLYNFMDGMDGFAAGMTLSGFVFMGLAAVIQDEHLFAMLAWVVAAASAGFMIKNVPPASIFMGDAGSATLGLVGAAFSLWGIRLDIFNLWFPLLVFSPFIVDATITLMRRAWRREKVWQAHCDHYYQRLVLAGWGHKKTVLYEYVLMIAVGTTSMLMLYREDAVMIGLIFWVLIYSLLAYKADQFCKTKKEEGKS